jgi:hypothetical protein
MRVDIPIEGKEADFHVLSTPAATAVWAKDSPDVAHTLFDNVS